VICEGNGLTVVQEKKKEDERDTWNGEGPGTNKIALRKEPGVKVTLIAPGSEDRTLRTLYIEDHCFSLKSIRKAT